MSTQSTETTQSKYRNDLAWQEEFDQFDPVEQKVLLALSHAKYRWRTRDRLLEVTGLDPKELDSVLARLLSRHIVRPSFSKKKNIIFGLRERVN